MNIRVLNIVIAKTWGGGEQYVYDICKQMSEEGIDCYVMVDDSNVLLQNKYQAVAHVITANLYQFGGLLCLARISQAVSINKIDIINCHSGHSLLACLLVKKFTGVPVVMFKHNALSSKNDFYHRWQRSFVDAFICVSKLVYDMQTKDLEVRYKSKFHLVYNGIDTTRFDKYKLQSFRTTGLFTIGYAGRLADNKGIEILLQAFCNVAKKHPQVRLLIAGHDEKGYKQMLEKFVKANELDQQVKFLGLVEDMERFYKSLDLFVLPSIVKESFGLVICEALYCGVPVVATDSGAQKEIITSDTYGSIVSKADISGLEQTIELYLVRQDHNFIKRKEYVKEKFNIFLCVDKLLDIYECIMKKYMN